MLNIYVMELRQYTNMGTIEQIEVIIAKNEEDAWKELHTGKYIYKDAELIDIIPLNLNIGE